MSVYGSRPRKQVHSSRAIQFALAVPESRTRPISRPCQRAGSWDPTLPVRFAGEPLASIAIVVPRPPIIVIAAVRRASVAPIVSRRPVVTRRIVGTAVDRPPVDAGGTPIDPAAVVVTSRPDVNATWAATNHRLGGTDAFPRQEHGESTDAPKDESFALHGSLLLSCANNYRPLALLKKGWALIVNLDPTESNDLRESTSRCFAHLDDHSRRPREKSCSPAGKKTDAVDHPEVAHHVGLLVNGPPGVSGLPLI